MRLWAHILISAILLALLEPSALFSQVVFNEIVTSNGNSLRDEDGDSPDWVEIYNPGNEAVNLGGFGLTDDPLKPFKWVFQPRQLPAKRFLVVFASGKNRQPPDFPNLDPAGLEGIRLWLRADQINAGDINQVRPFAGDPIVTRWVDQSGLNNHADQTALLAQPKYIASHPDLGNKPVVRFDGSDDLLVWPQIPATNSFTIIAVVRPDGLHEIDSESAGTTTGTAGQKFLFGVNHGGEVGSGAGLSMATNGASVYEHAAAYMPPLLVHQENLAGRFLILTLRYEGRQPSLYLQGCKVREGLPSPKNQVTGPTKLGGGDYGFFQGDVAEVLIFNRALPEAERRGVEQFLSARHGVPVLSQLHTSFTLKADGEPLQLVSPDGKVASAFPELSLPRDVSFGSAPDGSAQRAFFAQTTPGRPNHSTSYGEWLEPPVLSPDGGFFTSSTTIRGAVTNANAVIRYTTDGSEPTETSPLLPDALVLNSRAGTPNDISMISTGAGWQAPAGEVFKAHIIRARTFKTGLLPSKITTRTFLVDPKGRNRYSLPVISLATHRDNFFSNERGIYVRGTAAPVDAAAQGNFWQRGEAWERPIHVELWETNSSRRLAQDAGVRIHGGTSRQFPQKNLRFYGENQGGETPFEEKLFPDKKYDTFERFILRAGGHDHYMTFTRDELQGSLARDVGLDTQLHRPTVVFLNGEYWGIHYIRESIDQHWTDNHYGTKNVDILEGHHVVDEGDDTHYVAMLNFMNTADMKLPASYEHIKKQMEVDNFIDFKATEIYCYRWDIGNIKYWRPRTPEGRWRWFLYDMDVGFGGFASKAEPWNFNMLEYDSAPNGPDPGADNNHNNPTATFLLRKLLENEEFKHTFINRFADLLNTTFRTENVLARIQELRLAIKVEIPEQSLRWRLITDANTWEGHFQTLKTFAERRPASQRQHIISKFGLAGTVDFKVTMANTNAGDVIINTITVSTNNWTGVYFKNVSVPVKAVARPGYRFVRWQGRPETSPNLSVNPSGDQTFAPLFELDPNPGNLPLTSHVLSSGAFEWNSLAANSTPETLPRGMHILQTPRRDPGLTDEFDEAWKLPFNLTTRSRVNGLAADGLSFVNTDEVQPEGGGHLGALVLNLDTRGISSVAVQWTGGTVDPNDQNYAIRLQYRVGLGSAFQDLKGANNQVVEYSRNAEAGHFQQLGPVLVPSTAANQELVQLRWKYFRKSGDGGTRSQLRLDDIRVSRWQGARSAGVRRLSGNMLEYQFEGEAYRTYTVLYSDDLKTWRPLRSISANASGLIQFQDATATGLPHRFYRLGP